MFLSKSVLALGTAIALTACGGSSSSSSPQAPEKAPDTNADLKTFDSLVHTLSIQNEVCPNGGIEIEMGIDSNSNGRLDPEEIDHSRTQTVCHGANGINGANGHLSLISITAPSIQECPLGGKKVIIGIDSNTNQILESAEITQTELLCNAVINESDSISSLVTTVAEIAGANCAAGGIRIDSGLDLNSDQNLDLDEIQSTSFVCSGQDGVDGQDGSSDSSNLDNLLIETIDEPYGENCLHGGDKHRIGLDENLDGILQEGEVSSASYSCNSNAAPYIEFWSTQANNAISGFDYALTIQSYDYDNSIYGSDDVELMITSKPSWLTVTESNSNTIILQGRAVGDIGDTFTISVSSTDSDLTTEKEYTVTIVDGIQISVSAEAVIEGNLTEQGLPVETPAEFVISLSKAASSVLQVQYHVEAGLSTYGQDWKIDNQYGVIVFEVGETKKRLPLTILSDNQYELEESVSLNMYPFEYIGEELLIIENQQSLLVTNDDQPIVELHAGQVNIVEIMNGSNSNVNSIVLINQPVWMNYLQQYSHICDQTGCYEKNVLAITGIPPIEAIGDTASFDIELKVAEKLIAKTLTYIITEGDKDEDGVVDSVDIFPQNPRGQTDVDLDGIGDEWEIKKFDSLVLADSYSDFDVNGVTDKSAFENGTSINDISFNFESGELPIGWINTGNVSWVVSDTLSYDGQYALTLEHALGPNETARIEFDISTQQGELKLYTRAAEQINNSGLRIEIDSNNTLGIYASLNYWNSNSGYVDAGQHKLAITYRNYSSTHNAPVIYIDNISGLAGMIPADRDGDGVSNNADEFPDRSDAATDTDEDGIADEWEQRYFGTLDRVNATSDFDNDGLLDINEFIQATNPSTNDSDNDGVIDAQDAFPTSYQYQADSDSDGLADKWELAHFGSLAASDGSQDSDGDLTIDLIEFLAGTPPTPDGDSDGVADIMDAYPDNSAYQTDSDNDGLADKWENQYAHLGDFSADGDFDQDGRSNLEEFLMGTSPIMKNLNAVEDIFAVVQGQTINFDPTKNDIATQGHRQDSVVTISVSLPEGEQANFGSLQDNADGTFSYTAANDRLGWLRLSYIVSDGESNAEGEIFIRVVEQTPAKVVKIDGGNYSGLNHSMALFDDGSLYAWGDNNKGQLGLGTTINNYVPARVSGLPVITDFSLGNGFSLALAADGSVWQWGNDVSTATQLPDTGIKAIAASAQCCTPLYYLLKEDGSVTNNGYNVDTSSLTNIKEIKAGYSHLLALDEAGIVWAAGANQSGQLGYGQDTSWVSSPVQVSKITNIRSIEAGGEQSFAIDENGQLFAWGLNQYYAALGDGTNTNRNVPVLIDGLTHVAEVAAGFNHTLVRTETGELYGMGSTSQGALGIGCCQLSTPTKVSNEKVISVGVGSNSTFFITEGGASFSLGSNDSGQLGDGTTEDRSEPAEISWLLDGVVSELGKEGFEWGRIPPYWRNSGDNWEIVSNTVASDVRTGSYSAKVKERLSDNASASLGLQIATGKGDVSFNVRTSTEVDYDKLVFYVDGIEQAVFSGDNDWVSSASVSVAAGVHSFEWVYHKDGGTSAGKDTVWIDDILLPIDSDGDGIIDRQDASPYAPNP